MSFTAEVKDELSRVEGTCPDCNIAQLSALVRICGTLSYRGPGHYSIRIATETGAVARTIIKLAHKALDLDTTLTVRRSVLHKTRNYLIEIPDQPKLPVSLVRLGILDTSLRLMTGVSEKIIAKPCCRAAYLRGAFMAGGFVADPRGDFHLEVAVTGESFAQQLLAIADSEGVSAKLNHRRGAYAMYIKNFGATVLLLRAMGAKRSAAAVANVRRMKSVKNDVNRRVNAEIANQARSTGAAADQLALIDKAEKRIGLEKLPPAVREFCELRRAYPELSLRDLGRQHDPALSKSALYHRLLRLQELLKQIEESDVQEDADLTTE